MPNLTTKLHPYYKNETNFFDHSFSQNENDPRVSGSLSKKFDFWHLVQHQGRERAARITRQSNVRLFIDCHSPKQRNGDSAHHPLGGGWRGYHHTRQPTCECPAPKWYGSIKLIRKKLQDPLVKLKSLTPFPKRSPPELVQPSQGSSCTPRCQSYCRHRSQRYVSISFQYIPSLTFLLVKNIICILFLTQSHTHPSTCLYLTYQPTNRQILCWIRHQPIRLQKQRRRRRHR